MIGHRGASAVVPENTLPAFLASWDTGAAWVEADTQPTADGVPVILHDADLDRTTTGRGWVRERSAAQVAQLGIRGLPGAGVPTLAQLLALLGAGRNLLLEIKGSHSGAEVAEIVRVCAASGQDHRIFLQSFEVPVLEVLRELAPGRPFGLLVESVDDDPLARCAAMGATAYNPAHRAVLDRPELVGQLRAAGIAVAVWTCDDPAGWEALTRPGWTRSSRTPRPNCSPGRQPDSRQPNNSRPPKVPRGSKRAAMSASRPRTDGDHCSRYSAGPP